MEARGQLGAIAPQVETRARVGLGVSAYGRVPDPAALKQKLDQFAAAAAEAGADDVSLSFSVSPEPEPAPDATALVVVEVPVAVDVTPVAEDAAA